MKVKRRPPYIAFIACGFIVIGLIGLANFLWQRHQALTPVAVDGNATLTHSTNKPNEASARVEWFENIPADHPRRISLPTIHTEGFIQKVGVDQHRAIAVPNNISVAGWYTQSVRPGEKGVSIIDGHVQGRFQPGVFRRLEELAPRAIFTIEFGDRSTRQFEVVSVLHLSVADATKQMLMRQPGIERQLNLITCAGNADREGQYGQRLLIVSKYVKE